jgi:DNA mismatch repair protein MSH5
VKWGVDPELDQLKHLFAGLEDILAQVRMRLLQIMPGWARVHPVNCIFYPQLGFLVAVVLDPETGQGAYHGQGLNNDNWVKMFTNEGLVLYKTRMMRDLDQTYGDPYGQLVGMYTTTERCIIRLTWCRQGDRDCSCTRCRSSKAFGYNDFSI